MGASDAGTIDDAIEVDAAPQGAAPPATVPQPLPVATAPQEAATLSRAALQAAASFESRAESGA